MNRGWRRQNRNAVKQQQTAEAAKIIDMKARIKPQWGFGITITNQRIGVLFYRTAYTFNWPWHKPVKK